jgi:hypothetical protein
MSLLWVRAGLSKWYQARQGADMPAMTRHRDQIAQAHGVPGFKAAIALRPVYNALSKSPVGHMSPTDAGFASGPKLDADRNLEMPWSDDHPLNENKNWDHIPAEKVNISRGIHATQEGVNASTVAHNLFHPGKLPPISWPGHEQTSEIGHPDVDPDSHDRALREEHYGADESSKVPRFYRDKTGKTYVADGHHQVSAALLLKKPHIEGRVWDENNPPEGVR